MALPPLIEKTYGVRKKRFLDAYDASAVDAHVHRQPNNEKCDICGRTESRGLHELHCPDGSVSKVGPDCLEAFNGLNAGNIDELRELVDPMFRIRRGLHPARATTP